MPRTRRTATVASTMLACTAMLLSACGGEADGGASDSTSAASTTSSTTSPSETSSTTSPSESETPDPYTITCALVGQPAVDDWTAGGEPATAEPYEDGCRVVSSDPEGALIVQWRYLDVRESSADRSTVQEVSKTSQAVDIMDGVTAVRSETDVDPTRTVRLYVTFDNRRTLYAEATATLDRPRTVRDLRRITTTIVKAYADQPPLPTPSSASDSASP